jgi:uncharacterized membrane protein HdeD (DUF308 family)
VLENALAKSWWIVLLRGIIAVLFGLFALFQPAIALISLIAVFGAFALIEGVLTTVAAFRAKKSDREWWLPLIEGLVAIAFGLIAFFRPGVTAVVLLLIIAAWAVVLGSLRVAAAIRLRNEIQGEGWMILGGLASIAFGILAFLFPGAGALAALLYIAIWALVTGVALIAVSFKLRSLDKSLTGGVHPQVQAPAH